MKQPNPTKVERACQIERAVQDLQTEGSKVSFAAVARRVGISTALIHNKHPELAQKIRHAAGIVQTDTETRLRAEVARLSQGNARLAAEVAELRRELAKQASINEALRRQSRIDKAVMEGKVIRLAVPDAPTGDN